MSVVSDRKWCRIVCVASGPSLDKAQADTIAAAHAAGAARIVVVNTTWRMLPSADVLYAADLAWWRQYHADVAAGFSGEMWTQDAKAASEYGLRHIRSMPGAGIPEQSDRIAQGRNSGHQAIGLAYRFGARRIVLVGYDMQRTAGLTHWHGDHPQPLRDGNPAGWVAQFAPLATALAAAGVEVINASAATALTCFPRADLAAALT